MLDYLYLDDKSSDKELLIYIYIWAGHYTSNDISFKRKRCELHLILQVTMMVLT